MPTGSAIQTRPRGSSSCGSSIVAANWLRSWKFQAAPGPLPPSTSTPVTPVDGDNFPADRLGRRTLRAEIVGFNPQPDPPGKYAATLEVYSQLTGHTSLLIGNPDTLPPVPGIVVP